MLNASYSRCRTLSAAVLIALTVGGCKDEQKPRPQPPISVKDASSRPIDAAPPRPKSALLWSVETPAGVSYLFGTMHAGVDAERDLAPRVWRALDSSEQVILEVITSDFSAKEMRSLAFAPKGVNLRKELTRTQWKVLRQELGEFVGRSKLAEMSPIVLSVLVASNWVPKTPSLDQEIEGRAKAANKRLLALENFEQTSKFMHRPIHTQALGLMLSDIERSRSEMRLMHAAYLAGDARAVEATVFSAKNLAELPELYEALFFERNRNWIPRIEKTIMKSPSFVAVGAGHLLGSKGVIALLREQGHTVTRVVD